MVLVRMLRSVGLGPTWIASYVGGCGEGMGVTDFVLDGVLNLVVDNIFQK